MGIKKRTKDRLGKVDLKFCQAVGKHEGWNCVGSMKPGIDEKYLR